MMHKKKLNYFYHPTTTVFLDDNHRFLQTLTLNLGNDVLCRTFNDPRQALMAVHQPVPKAGHRHSATMESPVRDALFNLPKSLGDQRFQHVSVVVVDYEMPAMDGITFCQQIQDPHVKKILLTGVADEKVAIRALNNRLIDYYIHKSESALIERLLAAIQQLQTDYFQGLLSRLHQPAELAFMHDPVFMDYFQSICEQNQVAEYYFMDNPLGFLLIDTNGQAKVLLVFTDGEMEAHQEVASSEGAPDELLQKLQSGDFLPYFSDDSSFLYKRSLGDAEAYLHPATCLQGSQPYYCALVDAPDISTLLPGYAALLDAYQNRQGEAQ